MRAAILLMLLAVPAYADSYTLEFFTAQGPAPTSGIFEYANGRFIAPIVIKWDIAEFVFGMIQSPSSAVKGTVEGCQGTVDESFFGFLTGQCGPASFSFYLNSKTSPVYYEGTAVIYSQHGIEAFLGAMSFMGEAGHGYPHSEGTMMARPATVVQSVAEPSSVSMLAAGLILVFVKVIRQRKLLLF